MPLVLNSAANRFNSALEDDESLANSIRIVFVGATTAISERYGDRQRSTFVDQAVARF
jgi:hypothetical protein